MTDQRPTVLIIGGGAAGHACASALRREGFDGEVTVVHGEEGPPINRTLVDKGVLPGLLDRDQIALPPVEGVEVLRSRAERLEAAEAAVVLADGRRMRADALVLACGSAPRPLDARIPVDPAARLHRLHGAADAVALREAVPDPDGRRIAVLGAGFIGSELATHYAGAGAEVVLVGRSELPMRAAVGSLVAARLAELHRARVDARLGVDVAAILVDDATGRTVIELADGSAIDVDAVVVAQGSDPASAWAGWPDGIPVDDRLRAADRAGVYAAGGSALLDLGGARTRIDHWDAAVAQGAHAARAVLHDFGAGEDPGPYLPRSGFTLMAHGSVIGGRGVLLPGGEERAFAGDEAQLPDGALLAECLAADGSLTALAGFDAGAALVREAARLFERA